MVNHYRLLLRCTSTNKYNIDIDFTYLAKEVKMRMSVFSQDLV